MPGSSSRPWPGRNMSPACGAYPPVALVLCRARQVPGRLRFNGQDPRIYEARIYRAKRYPCSLGSALAARLTAIRADRLTWQQASRLGDRQNWL
jgi:hypothetical protein